MTSLPRPTSSTTGPVGHTPAQAVAALRDRPASTPASARGADAAVRSAEALHDKRAGLFDGVKKAAVAALVGVTLLSTVAPAHAEPTAQAAPQTSSWFEAAPPTGPPAARALLGLDTARTGGAMATVAASSDGTTLAARDAAASAGLPGLTPGLTPASAQDQTQAAVEVATRAALDAFTTKVTRIMRRDAASLAADAASGALTMASSSPTAAQEQAVEAALKDLVQSLPVGAFAPPVQASIQAATTLAMRQLGHDDVDVRGMSLRELEKLTGDRAAARADALVRSLRSDHPTAFWSAAAAVAAGGVALAYAEGTDALRALGLKPELTTTVLRGQQGSTRLHASLDAGPRFADPRATLGVSTERTMASGAVLRGGVQARLQGAHLAALDATGALQTPGGFSADVAVRLDGRGQPFDARLSARQSFAHHLAGGGAGTAWATARWSNGTHGTAASSSLAAGVDVTHGAWSSSLGASYSLADGRFTSTLSAGRTFILEGAHRLDVAVRASHDNRGVTGIGVGATLSF